MISRDQMLFRAFLVGTLVIQLSILALVAYPYLVAYRLATAFKQVSSSLVDDKQERGWKTAREARVREDAARREVAQAEAALEQEKARVLAQEQQVTQEAASVIESRLLTAEKYRGTPRQTTAIFLGFDARKVALDPTSRLYHETSCPAAPGLHIVGRLGVPELGYRHAADCT